MALAGKRTIGSEEFYGMRVEPVALLVLPRILKIGAIRLHVIHYPIINHVGSPHQ
jgi:hypothetical protein